MRLLRFESSRFIKLEDDPDGNIPHYATLSYSWGDETETMGVQEINYPVSSSLKQLLEFSRRYAGNQQSIVKSSAIFWIDTCCIDKGYPNEGLMALEASSCQYRNATTRGEQTYSESSILKLIATVLASGKQYRPPTRTNRIPLRSSPLSGVSSMFASISTNDYQATRNFVEQNKAIWNNFPLDEPSTCMLKNLTGNAAGMGYPQRFASMLGTTISIIGNAQILPEYCTQRGQNYYRSSWIFCQTRAFLRQIPGEVADGLLCKSKKNKFLRSRTRFLLRKVMNTTNLLIGDGEIGPQAGPPSMGREDDDDDDCVGFHRFSRLNPSSKMVEERAQSHARLNICNLHNHSQCATIPKYGPPKRDPVAAAISGPVRQLLDASTLSTWRDVISRTCGEGADLYSAKTKVWHGNSSQSAVVGWG